MQAKPKLGKTILKILSTYRKNILGKQLSQAICSKYVFRLFHAPNFQAFFYKIKYDGQSCQTLYRCSMKSCSDEFYEKKTMRESLFY